MLAGRWLLAAGNQVEAQLNISHPSIDHRQLAPTCTSCPHCSPENTASSAEAASLMPSMWGTLPAGVGRAGARRIPLTPSAG
jgi:hypothetical protein